MFKTNIITTWRPHVSACDFLPKRGGSFVSVDISATVEPCLRTCCAEAGVEPKDSDEFNGVAVPNGVRFSGLSPYFSDCSSDLYTSTACFQGCRS